ncbi:hypothetical protein NDU88_001697 [Pleurodeles waltl]|uniref:Tick transposon n=1 Tax=Pleurodeles waltl TaxID=8319 RepID=A0AAV7LDJ8_PLEWA|nr:hypothetical protein NDU88_001697 [Pleurodeles waltl]
MARTVSDHSPLLLTVQWGRKRSTIPTWCLQSEALLDQPFREELNTCIRQYWDLNAGSTDSRATEWDAQKVVVRGHCLSASWGACRSLHTEVVTLEKELRALEVAVAQTGASLETLRAKRGMYEEADQCLRQHDYNYHLTVEEIGVAIAQMACNKTPGTDGLPIEYYVTYAWHLSGHLLSVFEEAWTRGILPLSQTEALVVVLPKQGRDPTDMRSYRFWLRCWLTDLPL